MNITKIISKTFDSRLKQIDLYASQASEIPVSYTHLTLPTKLEV